ncbi:MAG: metal-dependent hydrolase [Sphingobacteriales bacterium]|nr:metal-dependent hydrolase [Sphingobacteriales bacterium]
MSNISPNDVSLNPYNPEEIKVRRVNFSFNKDNPRFYYKNNPFSTHFINALHIVFPTGERFFVNSVLKYKNQVKDGKLQKQVRNFCGQEGIHSSMHERFWAILKENGYQIEGYENHIDKLLHKIVSKIKIPFLKDKSIDLVATACLEHFTALFGHALFMHVNTQKDVVPEDMAELFLWHAAEEIEHKHVAFDVMQKVDEQEYAKRVVAMPVVTALLYFYLFVGTGLLMYQDRKYINTKDLPKQFNEFATGLFNELHADAYKEYFKFFKKGFHPSVLNDYHLAEEFFRDKAYA